MHGVMLWFMVTLGVLGVSISGLGFVLFHKRELVVPGEIDMQPSSAEITGVFEAIPVN